MQIGIIGGGAAGMMAAVIAAEKGADVTLIEHTGRIGKKILSTGNGKCNFTNQRLSKADYNGNQPSFVVPVLEKFDQYAAIAFFRDSGMLTVSKRDGYYYPYTGQASTVLNMFRYRLSSCGVKVRLEEKVLQAIQIERNRFWVKTSAGEYQFDKLILACGGKAAPNTGSDGTGYELAKAFGHTVIKPLPVLTYLKSNETTLKELAGVRAGAKITLVSDGKTLQIEEGELQLNKDNLSGIPVFQLSHAAICALDKRQKVTLLVDFLPDYEEDEIKQILQRLEARYPQVPINEALCGILHKKVCGAILHKCNILFETKMNQLSEKQRKMIVSCSKNFKFDIQSYPGFEAAQATMGGVSTKEVDENLMSKKIKGLYFAGEILDVDGRCGGYNLQWAWSSAYVAASHSVDGEVTCYE